MKLTIVGMMAAKCFMCGCASIISGPTQRIPITSTPSGAAVKINGDLAGTTPLSVDLKRTHFHSITIEKDGYYPYEMKTTKGGNLWLVGNLAIPPWLPWFAVDFFTGAYSTIEPTTVDASLRTQHADSEQNIQSSYNPSLKRNSVENGSAIQPPPQPESGSIADRLRALKELNDAGILTDEEYQAKRKALVDEL